MEQVKDYRGLVKYLPQPFTAGNHDALGEQDVFMAKYNENGVIVPLTH